MGIRLPPLHPEKKGLLYSHSPTYHHHQPKCVKREVHKNDTVSACKAAFNQLEGIKLIGME